MAAFERVANLLTKGTEFISGIEGDALLSTTRKRAMSAYARSERVTGGLGRMITNPKNRKYLVAGAAAGVGMSASRSIRDQNLQSTFYNATLGTPNADEYVLGHRFGLHEALEFGYGVKPFNALPYANPTTLTDAFKRSGMHMPAVSGDINFGMYNSRFG